MRLQLHATPEEVMRAVQALEEFGREKQLGERDVFGLALALEESGSNIVDHTYKRNPLQTWTVHFDHTAGAITIELRDNGPQFDPTQRRLEPQTADSHGGWGLRLVRHYMDEICYQREGTQNVLRLTKCLSAAQSNNDSVTPNKNK